MTDRERFEDFWCVPVEGGCSYQEVYGSLGREVALAAWKASRRQALEEALQGCQELLEVSGRQARDGDHFEIGREGGHMECIAAIEALANPEGEQG